MSQCLRNLLDRHQKTGMEATRVSLTRRRKSPAPDVQLIQPQRQKQTPTTKKNEPKQKRAHVPLPQKRRSAEQIYSILFDLPECQMQILNRNAKESLCSLHFKPLGPPTSDPQLMAKMPKQKHDPCRSPLLFQHFPSIPGKSQITEV